MKKEDEENLRQLIDELHAIEDKRDEIVGDTITLIGKYHDDGEDVSDSIPEDILDGLHNLGMVDEETGELYI